MLIGGYTFKAVAAGTRATRFATVGRVERGGADHVVLGKSRGLEERAQAIGGRHLMNNVEWQDEVRSIVADQHSRISVTLDGLEGTGSMESRVMAAVHRDRIGAGSPFDWELAQLYEADRLKSTNFYEGGDGIDNPF